MDTDREEFHDEVPLSRSVELVDELDQTGVSKSSQQSELRAERQLLFTADPLLANDFQRKLTTLLRPAPINKHLSLPPSTYTV